MFKFAMDTAKILVANAAAGAAAGVVTGGFTGDADAAKQNAILVTLVYSGMELLANPIISSLGERLYNNIAYYIRENCYAVGALDVASAALSSGVKVAAVLPGLLIANTQLEPKEGAGAIISSDCTTLLPFLGCVLFVTNVVTGLVPETEKKLVAARTEPLSMFAGAIAMDKIYGTSAYLPAVTAFAVAFTAKGAVADMIDPAMRAVSPWVAGGYRAASSAVTRLRDAAVTFCVVPAHEDESRTAPLLPRFSS